MLFIHTHGVVQKCQVNRSYSCLCCARVSVIITMAVSRLEQEGMINVFTHSAVMSKYLFEGCLLAELITA